MNPEAPSLQADPPPVKSLVKAWQGLLLLALLELVVWQWQVYPPSIAVLILALPTVGFVLLWVNIHRHPVFVARLSILWLAVLLSYALMEILSHPLVRAFAIAQGILDGLLYFAALGVIRSAIRPINQA
jgi:hypothetical protein